MELERSRIAALQYETAVRQAELQLSQVELVATADWRDGFGGRYRCHGTHPARRVALTVEQVRGKAQSIRPDLLETRQAQARNQMDLRLQIAQGRIDVHAGTEYRRQQAPSGMGNSLGFFVSAPLPVFNRNQGEIVRAQREIDQAAAQIRALEARVNNEVASAWQQYSASRSLLANVEDKMLIQARNVRQTTEYSYRRGEATLIEFLDAQRAFNEVMQTYNEARSSYARSLYLIDFVTAGMITP